MKVIKFLGVIIGVGGFCAMLGAYGGLEWDHCTYAEFFKIAGNGLLGMLVGGIMANISDHKNGDEEEDTEC